MKRLCCLILSLAIALPCLAWSASPHEHPERWYQERWCDGRGVMEVVLPDRSRVDCLTDTHAVEFDFGHKWAEAIGQALNYSAQTGKRPGIVLILERPGDERFMERVRAVSRAFGLDIEVWAVDRRGQALH